MIQDCRNPHCREAVYRASFCPSCRWMGRRAFALGAFVAGIVAAVWKLVV